jgi:hypothetical protein
MDSIKEMENLPKSLSKSITSLRSFLDTYSISTHKQDGTSTNLGSTSTHKQDGTSTSSGKQDTCNSDESYLSDEDDCYISTTSRSRSVQRSSLVPQEASTVSPLTFGESTLTSSLSPSYVQPNVGDELTPYSLIRMLSGSVSSIIPSQFFSCDTSPTTIPEFLPRGKSTESTSRHNTYEQSRPNLKRSVSKSRDVSEMRPSSHLNNNFYQKESSAPYENRCLAPSMLYNSESSISKKSLPALSKSSHHVNSDLPSNPHRTSTNCKHRMSHVMFPSSLHSGISDNPKRMKGRISEMDFSNSSRRSFWSFSSRSQAEILSTTNQEDKLLRHSSNRPVIMTPSQSEYSANGSIVASPTIHGPQRSLTLSISPTFSPIPTISNMETNNSDKNIIETDGGIPVGAFLNRTVSSRKVESKLSSLWNEIPSYDQNSTREHAAFPITSARNRSLNHYDDLYGDYSDDDTDGDDESTVGEDKSLLSNTINLLKSFSFARSVSRVVDELLLPSTPSTAYDIRPITEETVDQQQIGEDVVCPPDEFVEVAEIGNVIAIVESAMEQTQKRSNISSNSGITVLKGEGYSIQNSNYFGVSHIGNLSDKKPRHLQWFSHGTIATTVALTFAILGVFFSLLARRSTSFVQLQLPLEISPRYVDVERVGMIWLDLCFNTTLSGFTDDEPECKTIRLEVNDIGDRLFEMSRAFLSLGCFFGTFLSIFLCTSVYWESINLKPIGLGYLVTYFFQSFALLFFDTKICQHNGCQVDKGGIYCIIASFCWLFTCVATAKMDAYKTKMRRRRRRQMRRERRFRREIRLLAEKIMEAKSKDTDPMSSDAGSV